MIKSNIELGMIMTFLESLQTCFKKYIVFNGRASRSEFWWFFLFALIVPNLIGFFDSTLFFIICLLILLPSLAVQIRRLHDIDRTGWWILINLVPIIGLIVLIIFFATEGTQGQNRFGPQPIK